MGSKKKTIFCLLILSVFTSCKQSDQSEIISNLSVINRVDSLYHVLSFKVNKFDSADIYRFEALHMTSDSLRDLINAELSFLKSIQNKHWIKVFVRWDIKVFKDRYKNNKVELEVNKRLNKLNNLLGEIDKEYDPNDFKFVSSDSSFFYDKMDVPLMIEYFDFLIYSTSEAEKSVLLRSLR